MSDTRWSAQHGSVQPVKNHFDKLVDSVKKLCNQSKSLDTRELAQIIMVNICYFTFLVFLHLWSDILEEINHIQHYLQIKGIFLDKAVNKLRGLKLFLEESRDSLVSGALDFTSKKYEEMEIAIEKRGRRKSKKMMPGENAKDEGLTLKEELKRSMFECVDRLYEELRRRTNSIEDVHNKFTVLQSANLVEANDELQKLIFSLSECYDEFSEDEITAQMKRLRRHI